MQQMPLVYCPTRVLLIAYGECVHMQFPLFMNPCMRSLSRQSVRGVQDLYGGSVER
jgi:hypothetical protein